MPRHPFLGYIAADSITAHSQERLKNTVSILLFLASVVCNGQDRLLIAAASDLKFAMDSAIVLFEKAGHGRADITYSSSGKLTEQIIHGAPFDVFLSADISYPQMLKEAGHAGSEIYPYAKGHIVLWSRAVDVEKRKMDALLDPSIDKIAIANPKHAPYGKRAAECLGHFDLMDRIRDKLVYGENISQTAQFAATGAADIAIIALSLAVSPNMRKAGGKYYLIPEESHQPLIQGAVVTRHGSKKLRAYAFLQFLKHPDAVAVLEHFGFTIP